MSVFGVLYAGEEEWDGPCNLHDMIDFTDIPDSLRAMVSDYKINVIDIRKFENTEVFQTDVKQVFDFIRCSNDKKRLLDLVENDVYYKEMDDDAFNIVTKYTNSKELVKAQDYSVEGGKNDVCKAIRDLMDDSRVEGIEEAARNLLDVVSDDVIAEKLGLKLERVQQLRAQLEVEYMCNLSDGVEQKGIEKGIEKEHFRQIKNKLEKNKSIEQIAEEVELDVASVKKYIEILESK